MIAARQTYEISWKCHRVQVMYFCDQLQSGWSRWYGQLTWLLRPVLIRVFRYLYNAWRFTTLKWETSRSKDWVTTRDRHLLGGYIFQVLWNWSKFLAEIMFCNDLYNQLLVSLSYNGNRVLELIYLTNLWPLCDTGLYKWCWKKTKCSNKRNISRTTKLEFV